MGIDLTMELTGWLRSPGLGMLRGDRATGGKSPVLCIGVAGVAELLVSCKPSNASASGNLKGEKLARQPRSAASCR